MPLSSAALLATRLNMALLRRSASSLARTRALHAPSRGFHSLRVTARDVEQVRALVMAQEASRRHQSLHTSACSSVRGKEPKESSSSTPEDGKQSEEGEEGKSNKGKYVDDEPPRNPLVPIAIVVAVVFSYLNSMRLTEKKQQQKSGSGGSVAGSEDDSINRARDMEDMQRAKTVSWQDFYNGMLLTGEVQEIVVQKDFNRAYVVLHPNAIFRGKRVQNRFFKLNVAEVEGLEDRIREVEAQMSIPSGGGVSIIYESTQAGEISSLLFAVAVGALLYSLFRRGSSATKMMMPPGGAGGLNPFNRMTKADFTLVDPQIKTGGKGVKFADVAGLKQAKIEVREFVDYLKKPDKYKELGARPPKGAILFGPPGCGKTLLAKAVANESNVPFLSMNGSEFIEMIGGLGAARVRSLFQEARQRSPSIIYIDEIDAIGKKRSGGGGGGAGNSNSEADQTLNQLLVELDGIASKEGVIMLASTNRADVLDRALLRPGRFDRQIEIDLPDIIERKEMIELHMRGVVLDEDAASGYTDRLATLTPGFTGADLANLVNEAALHAARVKNQAVTKQDFEYAIERIIAGPAKKTAVLNPAERRIVAYHESGHAIVGWMLKHTDALLKVTIIPRTSQALGFAQYTPQDKKLYSPDELMDRMCMALGGRVAESITFNRITTGAQNDLEKVTRMAYSQIKNFGFNETVGLVSFQENQEGPRPYSKRLHHTMDLEARKLIADSYRRTEALLTEHTGALEQMAEALLKQETLNYADVEALLGEPPHGKKHLVSPGEYERQLRDQAGPEPEQRKPSKE